MSIRRRTLIASVCAATAIAGFGGIASAAPGDTALTLLKDRANLEIDRRLTTLQRLNTVVTAAKHLTDGDRSQLAGQLTADQQGLAALKSRIAADTDLTTARNDTRSIVTDYRVYVLVEPKVHITRAADAMLDATTRFTALEPKLQAGIDKLKASGGDTTALQQAMTDLTGKVGAANTAASGVAAQVIPLTPAQWPGAHTTLAAGRDSVATARADLRAARADAATIVAGLKAGH